MATGNVVITDHQDRLIDTLVETGRYQNASEVLRAGLRLVEREEQGAEAFRARLMAGYDEAIRGDVADGTGEEAMRRAFNQGVSQSRQRNG